MEESTPPSRSRSRFRGLLPRLVLAGMGVLFALLALELGLRVATPSFIAVAMADSPMLTGGVAPHPTLGFANRAGYSREFRTPEFRTTIRINERGLRDRVYPYAKPEGRKRMLVLGDSLVYGWGVEAEQSVPKRMEARLPEWDVLNTGCPGWGARQQVRFLKEEGIRYQPDAVVAFFCLNDPLENVQQHKWVDGQLAVTSAPGGAAGRVKRFLTRHVATYTLFARAKAELTSRPGRGKASAEPVSLWQAEEASLRELRDFCRERGIRLAMAYIPEPREIRHEQWFPMLRETCSRLELPLLDLTPELQAAARREPVFFRLDHHWTPYGHQVTADAVLAFLRKEGWLSAPSERVNGRE